MKKLTYLKIIAGIFAISYYVHLLIARAPYIDTVPYKAEISQDCMNWLVFSFIFSLLFLTIIVYEGLKEK